MNGSLQQLSATLRDLRCWPSPQAGSELTAYSADPPEGWLQRPLLRPLDTPLKHCVGFSCSFTGSSLGWGLCWVFAAAQACSGCRERGALWLWCLAFSLQQLLLLWSMGPRAPRLQWWQSMGSGSGAPGLWSTGSMVVVHRLSSSEARGIFLDQGLNSYLLHWQDSLP